MVSRYRHASSPHELFYSPHGSDIYFDYKRTKDDRGCDCLVKGCSHSRTDEVTAASRGCNVESIVRRAGLGDPSAVMPVTADMFADITEAPKNMLEAQRALVRAKDIFDHLPAVTRDRFGNDPMRFMASVSDGSYVKSFVDQAASTNQAAALTDSEIAALKKMVGGSNE